MTIREAFHYTFTDASAATLSLEVRLDQGLSLLVSSPPRNAVAQITPSREQWLQFRAALNHMLDAEDVTARSTVKATEPADPWPANTAEQQVSFERWLDKHTPLDDTDLNDPPTPEEVT